MPAKTTSTKAPMPTAPIKLTSRAKDAPREALFSIDDVEYTMPVQVELGDALRLALLFPAQADDDARGMLLVRQLCGADAFNALMGDSTMTRAQWATIVRVLAEKFRTALERLSDEKGN